MNANLKMIKISNRNKTFLTSKPDSITELKNRFKQRFGIESIKNSQIVMFDGADDIFIETDQDLLNVFNAGLKKLTFALKKIDSQSMSKKAQPITENSLESYLEFLSANLPENLDFVDELARKGRMPCKHCFFIKTNPDLSLDLEKDFMCEVCKDTKSLPANKSWNMIDLLMDSRIKKLIVKPIRATIECETQQSMTDMKGDMSRITKATDHSSFNNTLMRGMPDRLLPVLANNVR